MGKLIQYGQEIAEFNDDSIYDMAFISNHIGYYTSYGNVKSTYADCLGYSFDDKGKIYYNYETIAYCEDEKIIRWIGGETIAYYEGNVRGAAAAAIVLLFAPKNTNSILLNEDAKLYQGSKEGSSNSFGIGGRVNKENNAYVFRILLKLIFFSISLLLWYFVFTSSNVALDHDKSMIISVIILVSLLLNVFIFKNKDFTSIYVSTLLIASIVCIIIATFFDNSGYPIIVAFIISIVCIPIVLAGLCYIPSFIMWLLIGIYDRIFCNRHTNNTNKQ